jgi:CHAT domain-containing protein
VRTGGHEAGQLSGQHLRRIDLRSSDRGQRGCGTHYSLTMLPLHAAGHHPRLRGTGPTQPFDAVSERVVSSYTPTLSALARARRARIVGDVRQFAVGMPHTPGATPLPAVENELAALAARFPPPERGSQLCAEEATIARVLKGLAEHSWGHMACHANQNAADPSSSGFQLWDGMLTVADLAAQRLDDAELVFLSACHTAAGGGRLPDEAIHLASALQIVGYRHVVATMWAINDASAPRIADDFYRGLTVNGDTAATLAASALHQALRRSDSYPTEPLAWAPYIHTGA